MISENDCKSVAKRLKNGESVHLYYCDRLECPNCNQECFLTTNKEHSVNKKYHLLAHAGLLSCSKNDSIAPIEYEVVQDEVSD